MKAADLDRVLNYFNAKVRLADDTLHAWFVERQRSPRPELCRWLRSQDHSQKILFIGHRNAAKGQPWCDVHPVLWDLLPQPGGAAVAAGESVP